MYHVDEGQENEEQMDHVDEGQENEDEVEKDENLEAFETLYR